MVTDHEHPMQVWADQTGVTLKELAKYARCSETHLINLFAGRREASLRLATALSELTKGRVPPSAFLRGERRQ